MRIAVHHLPGTFSTRWLDVLAERGVPHARIDAFADDVLRRMADFDALLWNWTLHHPVGLRYARSITCALEAAGKVVFPDTATAWHYDDKVAQKYLLEAIGAPIAPTFVFYDQESASQWAASADYPLVFKLAGGAGSYNVRLVESAASAHLIIRRMFGPGMQPVAGYLTDASTKLRRLRSLGDVVGRLRRLPGAWRDIAHKKRLIPRQRGYVLFQEYLPDNEFDTRIVTIGKRAFGLRRRNRPGDFRASGSGLLDYRADHIDSRCVEIASSISRRLGFQCMSYDFVLDRDRRPALLEISYCFSPGEVYRRCEGYWDEGLVFIPGHEYMEDAILRLILDGHGGDDQGE
ncbi:MAG: hypothetical protein RBT60_04720 [Candidatus Krumholzibacteria bacterium]|jgi:glutathione synthase/RimK-type ligase-like ATP-grasp enzyme|nr:hypothetical protein [Candidatus Krumholzibacteria bacterium]